MSIGLKLTPEETAEAFADLKVTPEEASGRAKYPQPRSMTASDDELGIGSGMQPNQIPALERVKRGIKMGADESRGSPFDVAPSQGEIQQGIDFTKAHGRPMDPMEVDPIAQSVVLSTTLGPLGRAAANVMSPYIGAVPAGAGIGAAEAALGAKATGGDVGEAAKFGVLFGGIGAKGGRPNPAARVRNDAQIPKDIKRGATKAPKAMADDVDFRAEDLIDSSQDVPDVRKALVTKARSNPGAAEDAVRDARRLATAETDAVFDAIEQHHGPLDLQLVTDRIADLEARYRIAGDIPGIEAAGKVIETLNKHYGGNAGSTLTAAQLRKIRNKLGDVAFPGIAKEARPSGAKQALRDVYDEFNAAIEDVAAVTPGVDVASLRARNRQVSSMEPAQDALAERVSLEADRELGMFGAAKDKLKKGATGLNRRMRYSAETTGADNPALLGAPAYGPLGAAAQNVVGEPEVDPLPPRKTAAQFLMNGGVR